MKEDVATRVSFLNETTGTRTRERVREEAVDVHIPETSFSKACLWLKERSREIKEGFSQVERSSRRWRKEGGESKINSRVVTLSIQLSVELSEGKNESLEEERMKQGAEGSVSV